MPPYETGKLACESDIDGPAPGFPCDLITFAPLIPRAYISEKAMNDSGCKITKMLEEGKPGLNHLKDVQSTREEPRRLIVGFQHL